MTTPVLTHPSIGCIISSNAAIWHIIMIGPTVVNTSLLEPEQATLAKIISLLKVK
jgi:hypothetical protein